MDKQLFKDIGFTDGEIKVYFALIDLGEITSGPLIKKSGISGSKVYEILEKLIQKGLVRYVVKEKTKYFQVASISRILDYVDKKEQDLIDQKKQIKSIIPELEKRKNSFEFERESFVLEGYGGIKTFFKMILENMKRNQEYYVFSLGEDLLDKNVILFLEQFHNKREEKGIKTKLLMDPSERKILSHYKYKKMQIRFLKNPFPTGTFIFGDYVANVKFSDRGVVFVMKDKKMSKNYQEFFEDLWKKAKE